MTAFTIQIASVPDRERVVAEVWRGDEMVAELRREPNAEIRLQVYVGSGERWVDLPYQEFLRALDLARSHLE
jgi:hypothetical protein